MQPLSEVESVRRLSATVARWTFKTPVYAADDQSGLEIDGGGPDSIVSVPGTPTIDATYLSGVIVGHSWSLDDGCILAADGVYFPGQNGRIV